MDETVGRLGEPGRLSFGVGIQALGGIALLLPAFNVHGFNPDEWPYRWFVAWIAGAELSLVIGFALLFYQPPAEPGKKRTRGRLIYEGLYAYILPLSVGAAAFVVYVLVLYPRIPQELGGVRPQCSVLGLKRTEVSATFLQAVEANAAAGGSSSQPQSVVTTRPLSILFVGSDFVLVRRPKSPNPVLRSRRMTLRPSLIRVTLRAPNEQVKSEAGLTNREIRIDIRPIVLMD